MQAYVWRGLRLLAADKLDLMASVSGERFDQLMAKEGRVKFPEPLAEDKVEDGDEALAAYMASQAAEAGAGSESVPEKKRPRKSAAAAPAPAPAEEGEEEGEDSTVKKSKPE